jgi:hypothetical protein
MDMDYGGFKFNHQDDNTYAGPNNKFVVTQSRMVSEVCVAIADGPNASRASYRPPFIAWRYAQTWFYSLLCSLPEYRSDKYRATAEHGFRFLHDRMWDATHGGFTEASTRAH